MSIQLKGQNVTGYTTPPFTADMDITLMLITNKTGGTVTLNIYIYNQNFNTSIAPLNLQLTAGTAYEDDHIKLLQGDELIFTATGACDYCFDFEESTD
jgi:hypothetical protein